MSRDRLLKPATWLTFVAAFLLMAALWDPSWPSRSGPMHLTLLLDDSASMHRPRLDAAWRDLVPSIEALPPGSKLSLIRFGVRPETELEQAAIDAPATRGLLREPAPPRRLPLADLGTNIDAAIDTGRSHSGGELPNLILLVSDGSPTHGNPEAALSAARRQGAAVLWWNPMPGTTAPDTWIRNLRAPTRVRAGESFPVTLLIGATHPLRAEIEVLADGHVLARQALTLDARAPRSFVLELNLEEVGVSRLSARLSAEGDVIAGNDQRTRLVEVTGRPKILHLAPEGTASIVAKGLRAGGWQVRSMTPNRFAPALLDDHRLLILEQIAAKDLDTAVWQEIARAVRHEGLGLLLLGGPGTFGPGAYRHSLLEGLLPLLSEPSRRMPPAAVLFAVDKSGSMDLTTGTGASRLALARHAVTESMRNLAASDLSGLLLFDKESAELLPLTHRANPADAVTEAWRTTAGGGTRLSPALRQAMDMLSEHPVEHRLLVLVSDGRFSDAPEATELASRLGAADIEVVALAVGSEPETGVLDFLTSRSGGRLLRVDRLAELPLLMQAEVAARRGAVETGPVLPETVGHIPFLSPAPDAWPALRAYPVTRLRPGAELHLVAPNGDPLVASRFAGVGRVAALAAGLGPWAPAWPDWEHWDRLLGGLVQWTAGDPLPGLELRAASEADRLKLEIDAVRDGDWEPTQVLPLEVRDPALGWQRFDAEPRAPGRYRLEIPAPRAGRYDIRARVGPRDASLSLWHDPVDEYLPNARPGLADLGDTGLLRPWSPRDGEFPVRTRNHPLRAILAGLGLLAYLLAIVMERAPWRRWLARAF